MLKSQRSAINSFLKISDNQTITEQRTFCKTSSNVKLIILWRIRTHSKIPTLREFIRKSTPLLP